MKTKYIVLVLCAILLLSGLPLASVLAITPSVELKVTRVVWGTDPNTPVRAYPGDEGVSLTIEVQNYSPNETIKGVKALLDLRGSPFKDTYGNKNATATGTPVGGDVLNPPDYILPRGFFTVTFSLDIDSNAVPQTYSCNITMSYSVNVSRIYVEGEPQTATVNLIVSKPSSTISCSVTPISVEKGETVEASGAINPVRENATVTLTYKRPDASTFSRTVQTKADGSYRHSYQPTIEGVWTVNASWLGDDKYSGNWASASFEVRFPVSLKVDVPDIRLVGDREKRLNVTLSNRGEVLISSVEVTLSFTSTTSPLVIKGDSHWTVNYLEPGNSTVIPVTIYAPRSALGSTYSASLSLSYRDDYGQSHSETHSFGFVVKGWVELVVYEKTVSPLPVNQGSSVTLSATLLNKGNAAAMYTNMTFVSNSLLELLPESTTYVGEVEENSPAPFTVRAKVKSDVDDGVYPVTVRVSYRDDQHTDRALDFTLDVAVERSQSKSAEQSVSPLTVLWELRWTLAALGGASLAILILYWRRVSAGTRLRLGRESA